jgi:hypothetical protein
VTKRSKKQANEESQKSSAHGFSETREFELGGYIGGNNFGNAVQ